jgi:tol-pal system protein YbgF
MLGQEPSGPLPLQAALTTPHRSTARTTARLLAVAVLLGGCAASADVAGLATQDELLRLRTDVTALQRSLQQARGQTEAMSGQVSAIQATNQRLDSLTATLAALTRRVEDLTNRVETLGRQMRTAVPAAPRPSPPPAPPPSPPAALTPPPTAAPVAPAPPPPPTAAPLPPTAAPVAPPPTATASPAAATPARPTTGALQPNDLYQAAYIDFSKGSYALAIDGFREFLRRYPDQPQANSAQYWIGESHVALAQQFTNAGQGDRAAESLQRAVQEFRKVVANYPRGDKAPTALYKEALTLLERKQPAIAQARLQYLVDNFPQAEETPLARERLAALRQR